jgi:hypothetical protein
VKNKEDRKKKQIQRDEQQKIQEEKELALMKAYVCLKNNRY